MNLKLKMILAKFLEERIKVTSWGVTDINIFNKKLKYHVNGLKYSGVIEITATNNNCMIKFTNKKITCKLADLVDILDNEIEHTSSYSLDLEHWIRSIQ